MAEFVVFMLELVDLETNSVVWSSSGKLSVGLSATNSFGWSTALSRLILDAILSEL